MKFIPKVVDKIYTRSRFNPDKKTLLIWALYPLDKRPRFIDIGKVFGHLMVQRVDDTNPMETASLNVNMAKFTQTQIENLVKEKSVYESRNKLLEQENAKLKD